MKALLPLMLLFLSSQVLAGGKNITSDLRFTNRAQCALDSKLPSESSLVLLSNMDIGRSLYRLAKVRGEDTNAFTKLGLSKYRYTVLSLLELIHKKLVSNQLPILPSDLSLKTNLTKYSEISQKCSTSNKCPELDDYLAAIWDSSHLKRPDLSSIDNFNQTNFLNLEEKVPAKALNCSYLKKFTPLEAQLFGTKPTADVLEQIAKATAEVDDYYSDCHDYSAQESLKVSTYEISTEIAKSKRFEVAGFDYWNSMKVFFSWAFRNSKEAQQMAYPFDEIFSSVLIEDSLFMTPNGCKSLVSPKCDPQTINQNSIRMFAKNDFQQSAANLDVFRSVPEGATKNLIEDQFPVVNQDILGFANFETADSWTESFRQNFSETRLTMRKKFVTAVNNLSLISKGLRTDNLESTLENYFRPIITSPGPGDTQLKSELYYLCAESAFLSSEDLSYLKPKMDILGKINTSDNLTDSINSKTLNEIYDYYTKVAEKVNKLCSSFDQSKVFDPDFIVDKTGFNRWYLDTVYEGKVDSMASILRKVKLQSMKPMLAYGLYASTKDVRDVICIDSTDCARTAIQSIVDIYSVVQYSELFLNIKNEISSSNMLNPYAERTACKVYDPWYKTKASLFAFGTDVAQAAVSSVAPGVIYGNFDLEAGKVTSFNQLVKDGKIQVDPKYEKTKVISTVALDLGSFTHLPCQVSISKSKKMDPSKVLGFRGVTVRACKANEKNAINVETSNEMGETTDKYKAACVQCSLDFEQVSLAVSSAIPFGRTAFFMARAVIRLYKGMKDPMNVPRSWAVNPYLVRASYDSHGGKIPNDCVRQLIKGKSCMKNACEAVILDTYTDLGHLVEGIDASESWRGTAKVKIRGCATPNVVKVYTQSREDGEETCTVAKKSLNLKCVVEGK